MARKSSRLRPKSFDRRDVILQPRRRMALIQRVDIVAPLLERGQPLGPRTVGIGDVVDLTAETVDLEHRLALRRAAECASRRRTNCRTRWSRNSALAAAVSSVMRRPPVSTRAAVRPRGASFRRRCRRGCEPSNSSGPRCTLSLRGSRTFSISDDLVGERLDHGDLKPEPEIPDFGAERLAFVEQRFGAHRERMQALQQRRR